MPDQDKGVSAKRWHHCLFCYTCPQLPERMAMSALGQISISRVGQNSRSANKGPLAAITKPCRTSVEHHFSRIVNEIGQTRSIQGVADEKSPVKTGP